MPGQKINDPRGFYGDRGPATYPIDYMGSAPSPARVAEAHMSEQLNLRLDAQGRVVQGPDTNGDYLQVSPPPPHPEAAAEAEDFKKRHGDLMNEIGDMRRSYDQRIEELEMALQLAQSAPAQRALPHIPIPEGLDPEREFKVRDFYHILPHLVAANQEEARAQALRAAWDVSPEEEASVLRKYPQVQSLPSESERLSFIKRVVTLQRRHAEAPANPAPRVPASVAAPPPTAVRQAAPSVPQPEVSVPSTPMGDQQPTNALEMAATAYRTAEARLRDAKSDVERRTILRDMREARDTLLRLQGVTEDHEKRMGFIGMGS